MDRKIKVVIADDQNVSRGFFEMYVRASMSYELLAGLRTAEEAVEFVDSHETDLLILDVMMQDGMDGLTAAEQIKSGIRKPRSSSRHPLRKPAGRKKQGKSAWKASGTRSMTNTGSRRLWTVP